MINTKAKILSLILAVAMLFTQLPFVSGADYDSEIESKKNEIENAEEEIDTLKSLIEKKQQELDEAKSNVSDITIQQINALSDEEITVNELEFLKTSIENLDSEIAALEAEHEELEAKFLERSRVMYQSSKSFDILNMIFTSKSISDFLGKIEIHKKIVAEDKALMESLKLNEAELADKKAQNEEIFANKEVLLAEIEALIADLSEQKEIADDAYDEIKAAINKLEQDEEGYFSEIDELTQELNDLEEAAAKAAAEAAKAAEEEKARLEKEAEEAKQKLEEAKKQADEKNNGSDQSDANFCFPIAYYTYMSSAFGYRIHPLSKLWKLHTGIDLASPKGTEIYAAQSGTVVLAGTNGGFGQCVIIDHGNGLKTLYGHCSKLLVSQGQTVTRGQTIALVGATGSATGNHLHFEVQLNGTPVQPLNYITLPY